MLLISIALPQPLKHMKGLSETTMLIKATHDGIYMEILTKHKHPISHDPGCELLEYNIKQLKFLHLPHTNLNITKLKISFFGSYIAIQPKSW